MLDEEQIHSEPVEPGYDIIATGSVTRELLIWAERFPSAGDAIRGPSLWTCGGMAGNLAHAAARLGGRVAFAAAIGDDPEGEIVLNVLQQAGVDTRQVVKISGMHTPVVVLIIDPGLQRAGLVLNEETQAYYPVENLPDAWLRSAKVFFTDLIPAQIAISLAARAHGLGVPVAYDLQMAVKHVNVPGHLDHIEAMFRLADIFFADRENFLLWRGGDQLDVCMEGALLERPNTVFVVTAGENGSYIYTREKKISIPAFQVPVADTIGAGDAFHAAFLLGLFKAGWRLEDAGLFASACAALSCRRPGARDGLPDQHEVAGFLRLNGMAFAGMTAL